MLIFETGQLICYFYLPIVLLQRGLHII